MRGKVAVFNKLLVAKMPLIGGLLVLGGLLWSCESKDPGYDFKPKPPVVTPLAPSRVASLGIVGDTSDVKVTTQAGTVIMGGSTDVDAAFRWMISRSGGGDVVVIRASGTEAYNAYIRDLGRVNSVETLMIDSRKLADDSEVARVIRNAEMLFIAGGDQSDYSNYWKGTKVMDALNYLMNEKKVPVGGTSAGAAILGNFYFSGEKGSVTSEVALNNAYSGDITLYQGDFLKIPYLDNVITDQHFSQRNREGRVVAFLGRIMIDWHKVPRAIAVDEKTAVCIDQSGLAEVMGENKAYFITTYSNKKPETFAAQTPITWNDEGQALGVTEISGKANKPTFDIVKFEALSAFTEKQYWWSVTSGQLRIKEK